MADKTSSEEATCDCASRGCGSGMNRRDFVRWTGLTAGLMLANWPAIAGPFEEADFQNLIPADKKLKPEWVRSLFERGEPTVYRGAELEKIGMPVGGLCCGQLYLGGDGRLWHWDIFNLAQPRNFCSGAGDDYAKPPKPDHLIDQGFAIKVTGAGLAEVRRLDSAGFNPCDIAFRGQYPMAFVDYHDASLPVSVSLEAFSPFVPLNAEDSSLPVTVMHYTVKNAGAAQVEVALAGWMENAVCRGADPGSRGRRRNQILREPALTMVHCTAASLPDKKGAAAQPDILFEDFENGYGNWTAEGQAFGSEPAAGTLPHQNPVKGFQGKHLVNSFRQGDQATGKLTSKPFTITRRCIAFLMGGGRHTGKTCMNLVVDGRVVRRAAGHDREALEWDGWDVSEFQGRAGRLEILDSATGPWGHINVDQITFTDTLPANRVKLEQRDDYGSMGLALLGDGKDHFANANVHGPDAASAAFVSAASQTEAGAAKPLAGKLVGAVGRKFTLAPGEQAEATFLVTWFFPGLRRGDLGSLQDIAKLHRHYSKRFNSAAAVGRHVAANFDRLAGQTRLWNQTWYDSSLPYWFLDRTFASICTLASNTCYQFDNGRFYAFEGVYCCRGTCQHVWNYAQSVGRIFPELERDLRRRTDFGTAWHENGAIDYRGECDRRVAHDGQCGIILRAWREHQMSPDDAFLRDRWPRIRKSIEYLIGCDGDENGLLEGAQYNTLDATWYGPMAWISSLYVAALRAGEAMATDAGDTAFAQRCRRIAGRGSEELVKQLFNGEYFIHKPDPKHPDATNSNIGCHIDQLMGQAWALQVGLPRIMPVHETTFALEAIWKYNFTPDVGPFREKSRLKGGRWYAMPGEGGVVMTTFPHGGADRATGKGGFAYYFNEVWTGQEHQLAAHMLWEGLADKALVVSRMLHDRHHAARRNPYNEVECSDHYARAMSSYGTFIAACGYEYHGPKGHIGFAPRLTSENFRAAFTAAEGWGVFTQRRQGKAQHESIQVKWGRLRVRTLAFEAIEGLKPGKAVIQVNGEKIGATLTVQGRRLLVTLPADRTLSAGQTAEILLS